MSSRRKNEWRIVFVLLGVFVAVAAGPILFGSKVADPGTMMETAHNRAQAQGPSKPQLWTIKPENTVRHNPVRAMTGPPPTPTFCPPTICTPCPGSSNCQPTEVIEGEGDCSHCNEIQQEIITKITCFPCGDVVDWYQECPPCPTPPWPADTQSDRDGLLNWEETTRSGTHPGVDDTTGDYVIDSVAWYTRKNAMAPDHDGDGLDGDGERLKATSPHVVDTDNDGTSDSLDSYPHNPSRHLLQSPTTTGTLTPTLLSPRGATFVIN